MVTGLERGFEAAGYRLIVASSRESEAREAELVTRMNDWRVGGVILAPVRSQRGSGTEMLRALDMQAVLIDRVSADDQFDTVVADNYAASSFVADYLLDAGHKHILLHGATRISKAVRTRVDGFTTRALALQPDIQIDTLFSDDGLEAQRDSLNQYFDALESDGHPTAVFSLSQRSTLLVLSELRRRALRIPDEVALIGFDDVDWMHITWPSITAVAQPVAAMAEAAVAALLARIEGQNSGVPVQHLEACTMLVRESVEPNLSPSRRAHGDD
ncbi:MAG: LacI family transcriptional regulator [Hyphomicrobiales bacterium]|nr:MAG: LacI family transcriptional regulator [Hyphomicrobiales bacterium]